MEAFTRAIGMANFSALALHFIFIVLIVRGCHGNEESEPQIVCKGGELILNRTPNGGSVEDIGSVEYVYTGSLPTGASSMIARLTKDGSSTWHININENYRGRVTHDGPEITVNSLEIEDSGVYETHVLMKDGGIQYFFDLIQVIDGLATEDGKLNMKIQKCVWDKSGKRYFLVLDCGKFKWLSKPSNFDVEIETSDGKVYSTDGYKAGYYHTAFQNPAIEGDYTCRIPAKHAHKVCGGSEAVETTLRIGPFDAVDCALLNKVEENIAKSEARLNDLKDTDDVHNEKLETLKTTDSEIAWTLTHIYYKHEGDIDELKEKDDEFSTDVDDLEKRDDELEHEFDERGWKSNERDFAFEEATSSFDDTSCCIGTQKRK